MNARTGIAALLIVQTLGCATTGKQCTPPEPPSEKAGEVIIYRLSQWTAHLFDAPISIDDCIIGMLADGSVISRKVVAKAVKIRAEHRALALGGDAEIRAGVSIGETVYVRFKFLTPTAPQFMIVDKATAEKELAALQDKAR